MGSYQEAIMHKARFIYHTENPYIRTLQRLVLFFALLLISVSQAKAQVYFPEDMKQVSGKLVDSESGDIVPYAHIINQRVHGGTISDKNGIFSLQADPSDTLTVNAMGFKTMKIIVADYLKKNKQLVVYKMNPIRYLVGEVEVTGKNQKLDLYGVPQGNKSKVPIELRSDDFNKKPHWTSAIFSPLSFLHYKLNKREKNKRKAMAAIITEQQWDKFKLVYNRDIVHNITGLEGDTLDDFMVYCNVNMNLYYSATSLEVDQRVRELFKQFKAEKMSNDSISN
ncbi:carboxypeptidase-like protein [Prolixibacter denitrificans]|uniref:Carboxypeptidase-like protein n=2 Tax=Prolixibacter denitrificans TaxID=1541063 RepID=A0A2P8CKU9_9BACT|nr:carboxypeptidase-like protein [Prolixibacter denitrificans]GET20220.1 hypothetical protein JCM18694_04660 [Prolixibacter denitrificans]